jgi:hypothetical protein
MTLSDNHKNGAFLSSRSTFDSDVWKNKPCEYFKIWFYLYGKANHTGQEYNGHYCERGQYFCTYGELLKQLEYKIGYRKKKYNDSFMKNLMKYLRDSLMISTAKKPRGILITLTNYDKYQKLENYEKTNDKTDEKTREKPEKNQLPLSINKNDYKNEEELKELNINEPLKKPKPNLIEEQAGEVLEYLITLFRACNFERYLNEKPKGKVAWQPPQKLAPEDDWRNVTDDEE